LYFIVFLIYVHCFLLLDVFSDRAGGEGAKGFRKEANEKELQALDDMKRRDDQQDAILVNIYGIVDQIHDKAKDMGGVSKNLSLSLFAYFYLSLFYCFAKEK